MLLIIKRTLLWNQWFSNYIKCNSISCENWAYTKTSARSYPSHPRDSGQRNWGSYINHCESYGTSLGLPFPKWVLSFYHNLTFALKLFILNPLLYFSETIAFEYGYSKTQNLTGLQKPVIRFLPREVAELLASYLIRVRPLEALLSRSALSITASSNYSTSLWVTAKGEPLQGSLIPEICSNIWLKFNLDLGFLEFRHFAIAISAANGFQDFNEEIIAQQAGHSISTSRNRYGRTADEILDAPGRQYLSFQACSTFHKLLGFRFYFNFVRLYFFII